MCVLRALLGGDKPLIPNWWLGASSAPSVGRDPDDEHHDARDARSDDTQPGDLEDLRPQHRAALKDVRRGRFHWRDQQVDHDRDRREDDAGDDQPEARRRAAWCRVTGHGRRRGWRRLGRWWRRWAGRMLPGHGGEVSDGPLDLGALLGSEVREARPGLVSIHRLEIAGELEERMQDRRIWLCGLDPRPRPTRR